MKISSKTWKSYIERLSRIDQKAAKSFADWFREHPDAEIDDLLNYAYYTSDYYGNAASELACEMYDEVAVASGKTLPPAEPARTATYGEVAKAIQGKLLTTQDPDAVGAVVGTKVKTVGLDTLLKNSLRDGAEFAWIPSGDTCAFCIMLASNGWQRASKKALKNGHASHVHNNCDCTYAIRFDHDTEVEGYDPDYYKNIYDNAAGNNWREKINSMRRDKYVANREKINAQKRVAYTERKVREIIANTGRSDIIKIEELNRFIGKEIVEKDNLSIRKWYVANVSNIPNLIDRKKSLEDQARQAFDLRNKFKRQARLAMADGIAAKELEKNRPVLSFDALVEKKMKTKGMTREQAIKDILETASKTNSAVNEMFDL